MKFLDPFLHRMAADRRHAHGPIKPAGSFAELEVEIPARLRQPGGISLPGQFIIHGFRRDAACHLDALSRGAESCEPLNSLESGLCTASLATRSTLQQRIARMGNAELLR